MSRITFSKNNSMIFSDQCKIYCLVLFIIILHYSPLQVQAQSRIVNLTFLTPSLFDAEQKKMKVYLPPEYDESNNDQYRLIIFLHGSGNSNSTRLSNTVRRAMDDMIQRAVDFPASINPTDFKIRPMIIVFPELKAAFNTKPRFSSAHQYENSEYFGNYEDVITKDLMTALRNELEFNLKNKINFNRETMGIAGFSSGGDGALRIGLKHRDKFIALGAHASYSSLRQSVAWGPILDQYREGTQLFVDEINGLSAVWIGLTDEGNPDLLVNSRGIIIPEKLEILRENAGVIKNYFNLDENDRMANGFINLSESDDEHLPYIYADCGADDIWLKGFNEDFIPYMDIVYEDYFKGRLVNDLGHQLTETSVSRSLDFIDSKMESTTSVIYLDRKNADTFTVFPNPNNSDWIHIELDSYSLDVHWIYLINSTGRIVKSIEEPFKNSINRIELDTSHFTAGAYTIVLRSHDFSLSERIVIQQK